ncbi:MAG: hypothetical protein L6W00_20035 [Lentisphaeria bacterium]|nr:MAG: hypothetical protein L6W00_20035 [Lentisphaeria bacterium]
MKYRFISLILTVALQLSGATVALLGRGEAGRNLADRIFAAGSDLEFVERDRIAAILRERRLNETQLDSASVRHLASLLKADLFVLADARKDGGEGRLLIFESNCGFRLADELLPAEGTEQAALELIRSKQTLVAAPENALFLASTGIRDRRFRAAAGSRPIAPPTNSCDGCSAWRTCSCSNARSSICSCRSAN